MTASTPSASALVTATVMPRSLKEPVGFCPSHLRYSSMPGAPTAASRGRPVADPRAQHADRPLEDLRGALGRERGEPAQRLAQQRELVRPEAGDLAALEAEPRARVGRLVGKGRRGLGPVEAHDD